VKKSDIPNFEDEEDDYGSQDDENMVDYSGSSSSDSRFLKKRL